MSDLKHADITGQILKSFFEVYNFLGYGFLEKVYENALTLELRRAGLTVQQQRPITVLYKESAVGEYYADLLVQDVVLVELKVAEHLALSHEAQLLNYLRATNIEVGLLLNFGPKPEHKRKLYTKDKKPLLSVLIDP
ncbi:MAG: GxxExxY protein [Acidobacteriota bacterium]